MSDTYDPNAQLGDLAITAPDTSSLLTNFLAPDTSSLGALTTNSGSPVLTAPQSLGSSSSGSLVSDITGLVGRIYQGETAVKLANASVASQQAQVTSQAISAQNLQKVMLYGGAALLGLVLLESLGKK